MTYPLLTRADTAAPLIEWAPNFDAYTCILHVGINPQSDCIRADSPLGPSSCHQNKFFTSLPACPECLRQWGIHFSCFLVCAHLWWHRWQRGCNKAEAFPCKKNSLASFSHAGWFSFHDIWLWCCGCSMKLKSLLASKIGAAGCSQGCWLVFHKHSHPGENWGVILWALM